MFGYLLWQLDFIFCSELTALKHAVGIPWGFLLELHGWWHILTAIGAHTFMVMVDGLTREKIEYPYDALRRFRAFEAPSGDKHD